MYRFAGVLVALLCFAPSAMADPLPSWNSSETKQQIIGFVETVSDPSHVDFVPADQRVAVFDNDGTLWSEQPLYFQLVFAMDRLGELAKEDPSILTSDVLRAAAAGDVEGVMAGGKEGLLEVVDASHSGLSTEAFQSAVADWLDTSAHPQSGQRYDAMVYQPMLELLSYLRDRGFRTYIVSGGGIDFMRVFAERVYGIPPEQVIGSMGNMSYQVVDGVPTIMKEPGIHFIDDKDAKPIGIARDIGRRPILVAGNSDGDFEMLEWATSGDGARLGMIVHHTDYEREWAYDRDSHIGRLERGLDEGPDRGWLIIDMAADWATVYPAWP
ncbi:MAG: HAD family hydrolase [Pseudomonadota bacterium]